MIPVWVSIIIRVYLGTYIQQPGCPKSTAVMIHFILEVFVPKGHVPSAMPDMLVHSRSHNSSHNILKRRVGHCWFNMIEEEMKRRVVRWHRQHFGDLGCARLLRRLSAVCGDMDVDWSLPATWRTWAVWFRPPVEAAQVGEIISPQPAECLCLIRHVHLFFVGVVVPVAAGS